MIEAALIRIAARSRTGVFRQAGKARCAIVNASSASAVVPSLATEGTSLPAIARLKASRTSWLAKSRNGSVKNGLPSPTSGSAIESRCRSAAPSIRSTPGSRSKTRWGDASSVVSSASSMKPARSHDSFEVFSRSLLTRYAMPGIISPTGTYSRTRKPSDVAACFSSGAIP